MVTFYSLVVALSTIARSFASPVDLVQRDITERSPLDFVLTNENAISRRQATNYNQDYTTGGTVNFSPSSGAFSLNWNTQNDFVVGVGWTTGTSTSITYGGSFSVTGGTGLLTIYGWTTNPLVEYYIIEDSGSPPSFGSVKGSVTSDGSSYTIWENQRVNEPSIVGTATFNQYISVRSSHRTSGTVTLENHFQAWAALGMNLGTMNYQVMAVEGWGGSGSAQQSVSKGGSGSGTPTTSTPATTPTTGTGGGGSGCSALWGQCGGTGFTGSTCCSTGTCKYSNAWYSQCLQ